MASSFFSASDSKEHSGFGRLKNFSPPFPPPAAEFSLGSPVGSTLLEREFLSLLEALNKRSEDWMPEFLRGEDGCRGLANRAGVRLQHGFEEPVIA